MCVLALCLTGRAEAATIDFEDLNQRSSFNSQGILDTYQGFEWGYGRANTCCTLSIGNAIWTNSNFGWASATASAPAVAPAPSNLGGTSYAWNMFSTQSLWIDFRAPMDLTSVDLAGSSGSFSATSIFLAGFDPAGNLVSQLLVSGLGNAFQTVLTTEFSGIRYLQFRNNGFDNSIMGIDNIVLGSASTAVPEPATLLLFGTSFAGLAVARRQRIRQSRGGRLRA
jgi:hypothetical protein